MVKILYVVLSLIGIGCGIWLLVHGIDDAHEAAASASWPKAPGRIVSVHIGRRARDYTPHILYTYTVAGTTYISDMVQPGHYICGISSGNRLLTAFKEGAFVEVPYSPANPSRSVLVPGLHAGNFALALVALTLLTFAVPFALGMLVAVPDPMGKPGSLTLPDDSPVGTLILFAVLAIFVEFFALWWVI